MSEALADEIQRLVLMVRERDAEIERLKVALAAEQAKAREFAGIILTHAAAAARGDDLRALDLLCERSRGTVVGRRALLDAADDVEEALKLRCIAMTAAAMAELEEER